MQTRISPKYADLVAEGRTIIHLQIHNFLLETVSVLLIFL